MKFWCLPLMSTLAILGQTYGVGAVDLQAKVADLEKNMNKIVWYLDSIFPKKLVKQINAGSTYTRWGRIACPFNGTELVYKGFMAGNKWNRHGGGSNTLCLPSYPTWNKYSDVDDSGGKIHGTEIEVTDPLSMTLFGKHVNNMNLPCAVCRSARASNLMIPARASCFPGWHTEYSGYLVSSKFDWQASSDYTCLDGNPDFLPGGNKDDEEHVVKVVEINTGSHYALPPQLFVNHREVACVVCSK